MKLGMLWYDPSPKTELSAKIARAVAYYSKKYSDVPNTCVVNPGIKVETSGAITPNHLWIGRAPPHKDESKGDPK